MKLIESAREIVARKGLAEPLLGPALGGEESEVSEKTPEPPNVMGTFGDGAPRKDDGPCPENLKFNLEP